MKNLSQGRNPQIVNAVYTLFERGNLKVFFINIKVVLMVD